MILHTVYLGLPGGYDRTALAQVMRGIAALADDLDGFVGFEHGRNVDAEGKSPGFPYGFVCRFSSRAALDRYAADPRHQALGAALVLLCGGAARIMVYDLDIVEGGT